MNLAIYLIDRQLRTIRFEDDSDRIFFEDDTPNAILIHLTCA